MHQLLETLDSDWQQATPENRSIFSSIGAFCVVAFCGSFRGPEMFLVDLYGLHKYGKSDLKTSAGKEYVIIPLLGRFKNELGEQYHLTPLIATTSSGLKIRMWIKRFLESCTREGRTRGPAFVAPGGEYSSAAQVRHALRDLREQKECWHNRFRALLTIRVTWEEA